MSKITALLILCVVSVSHGVGPDLNGQAEKTAYKSGVAFGENKSGIAGAPIFNVKMQGDSAIIQDGLAKGADTSVNENDPRPTKEDLAKGAEKKEEKKDKTWIWILLALFLLLIGAVIAYYASRRDDDDNNGTGTTPGGNGGGNGGGNNCGSHNNNGNHNGWTNGQGHSQHGNGNGNGHNNHCHN